MRNWPPPAHVLGLDDLWAESMHVLDGTSMTKPGNITEQSVAALVVEHLESIGADVYQEVVVPGGVADIVARVVAEIWIVEVKTGWSLELLEQCLGRKRQAHRVFAATVSGRNFREHAALAEALGI